MANALHGIRINAIGLGGRSETIHMKPASSALVAYLNAVRAQPDAPPLPR